MDRDVASFSNAVLRQNGLSRSVAELAAREKNVSAGARLPEAIEPSPCGSTPRPAIFDVALPWSWLWWLGDSRRCSNCWRPVPVDAAVCPRCSLVIR